MGLQQLHIVSCNNLMVNCQSFNHESTCNINNNNNNNTPTVSNLVDRFMTSHFLFREKLQKFVAFNPNQEETTQN